MGRRALVALAAVVATWLVVGAAEAPAGRIDPPGHQDANDCINNFGVDMNVLFGVPEQFRNRFCTLVSAGEHWCPFRIWFTDDVSAWQAARKMNRYSTKQYESLEASPPWRRV